MKLISRTVAPGPKKMKCGCGAGIEVIDDNGSIRCEEKCGFEIILEPFAIVCTDDDIEWRG